MLKPLTTKSLDKKNYFGTTNLIDILNMDYLSYSTHPAGLRSLASIGPHAIVKS